MIPRVQQELGISGTLKAKIESLKMHGSGGYSFRDTEVERGTGVLGNLLQC